MATLPGTALERGRVVPGARLLDEATGDEVSAWSFRGRRPLLLCFLHPDCDRCSGFVDSLRSIDEDVRITGTRILRVGAPGEARRRFLGDTEPPVVVLVDRDGAAWLSYPAPDHDFPSAEEVAGSLWHLATMCPECGISTWG